MIQELESGYEDLGRVETLPTPLSKIDQPYAYRDHSINYRMYSHLNVFTFLITPTFFFHFAIWFFLSFSENVDMGGIVCICMIAISLMLIYGAMKYKPSHLLPFFCLQLFDFAITT